MASRRDTSATAGSEAGEARPYLMVDSGGFAGTRFDLTAEEMVIGRNPGTDITVLDEGLSREHAVVLRDPESGICSIEDLQSSNGTKVNGKRVRSAELCHGDEVQLGRTVFRFLEPGLPVVPPSRAPGSDDDDTQAITGPEDPC
ncbi:MAG: FHA domain-containing protein [Myxococcales bacterium]|nr:FHA domain-containing protein [Myxococcales bacterium]